MAWYRSGTPVHVTAGSDPVWHTDHGPADIVPMSGIYICQGCRREITSNRNDPFPPQNHHAHTTDQGKIRWRLLVRTNTAGTRI